MLPKNIYNLNYVEGNFRELALINEKFLTNPRMPEIDLKPKKYLEVFNTEGELNENLELGWSWFSLSIFILSLKFIYAWNPDTKLNIARLVYIKQLQFFVSEPL